MPIALTRSKTPGRICIVDDTAIHVALLRAILEPRGHTVTPMTSAEEALPEVLQHPPQVLMVDISMPGMDGFSFVEELRSHGLSPETRIVFMTSGLDESHERRAAALGASDFLRKPFESEDTIRRVEALIAGAAGSPNDGGVVTPMHQHLLAVLVAAWRFSLPEELLGGRAFTEFSADELIAIATARSSGKARERGIELQVQPIPSIVMRGDRELAAEAWAQVLVAAVVRAEPGSVVTISLGKAKNGVTFRVGLTCTAATAARLHQLSAPAGSGAAVRVERRGDGGVDLVADMRSSS